MMSVSHRVRDVSIVDINNISYVFLTHFSAVGLGERSLSPRKQKTIMIMYYFLKIRMI